MFDDLPASIGIRLHHPFIITRKRGAKGTDRAPLATRLGARFSSVLRFNSREKGSKSKVGQHLDPLEGQAHRQQGERGWQREGPGSDRGIQDRAKAATDRETGNHGPGLCCSTASAR
jgi:hypothetical protein